MRYPRVTLLAGHYGSGKTNIAVNIALELRKTRDRVSVADLDIVNPYFRTKDSAPELEAAGVHLISSEYANSNVDVPAMAPENYAIIHDLTLNAVVDVGGDDRGALALGRYSPALREEGNYAMLLVANFYRPLTRTAAEALAVMREIETAGGLPFTGILDNSNLGAETKPQDILSTFGRAEELSMLSGLPIAAVTVRRDLAPETERLFLEAGKNVELMPIDLHFKREWAIWN